MPNGIFLLDREYTFQEFASLLERAIGSINDEDVDAVFSITDILCLLRSVNTYVPGEFEIRHTPSGYIQIVYALYVLDEAGFDERYIVGDFVDTQDREQNSLWINEKVVIAFIDRNLYGVAFMLYFYLGYLMTQDDTFGISHNISFQHILESCDGFPEGWRVKYRTTVMRALADLQDAGLIKWNAKSRTFEMLHITPYDPSEKV